MENPRRELAFIGSAPGFSVLLKRNCSISPSALAQVFALLTAVTLGIGIAFAVHGAWLVLPFTGLEIAALAAAFLVNGRHAADYERIEISGERLTVEVADAGRMARHEMDAYAARVRMQRDGWIARVMLRSKVQDLEVGFHLHQAARVEFAAELTKRLPI